MSKTPSLGQSFENSNRDFPKQVSNSANSVDFLPLGFKPSEKDIICGRARENFHHDGNRYFRDLIQQNVGPYLAARTKVEKTEAIAAIVDIICQNSPSGGFIKKDAVTGRWYRIKENEARDKVGHAIRKAVQRLEETKPRLAARIKKEFTTSSSVSGNDDRDHQNRSASYATLEVSGKTLSPAPVGHNRKLSGIASVLKQSTEPSSGHIGDSSHRQLSRVGGNDEPFTETGARFIHSQEIAESSPSSILEQLLGQNATRFSVAQQQGSLCSSRSSLGSLSAMANYLATSNVSIFPPASGITPVDSARLVAASLLAQPGIFRLSTALPHGYNQNVGLTPPPAAAPDKFWLTAAALRQQREAQKIKELEYARRLAFTALHDISHANESSSEDALEQRSHSQKDDSKSKELEK